MFQLRSLLPVVAGTLAVSLASAVSPVMAQSAEFTVEFTSIWSSSTHPLNFPSGPHYSGLIGGTHGSGVDFWELGEVASTGMERMAEVGSKTILRSEVNSAIDAGTAEFLLSGGGINLSPGSVSLTFEISEEYPLVTLVSMLAPSPDWWVGVGALDLRPGGEWVDELVVDLVVYDAGTDSGTDYTSPDMDTDPAEPISIKVDGPFADDNVVGTFTFTRQVSSVGDIVVTSPQLLVPLTANPLRDVARFRISSELAGLIAGEGSVELDVFDARGARVRVLAREFDVQRISVMEWDGRDGDGSLVPAGTYFLSLRAGRIRQNEKIVVVR